MLLFLTLSNFYIDGIEINTRLMYYIFMKRKRKICVYLDFQLFISSHWQFFPFFGVYHVRNDLVLCRRDSNNNKRKASTKTTTRALLAVDALSVWFPLKSILLSL